MCDDLVTRTDVERPESQEQRIGPAVDADSVAGAAVRRKFLFERPDTLAEDQPSRPHYLLEGRQYVVPLGLELRAVIPCRNGHE